MTSQVINGVALGTGATHIRTLYHNTTGGNVRILWNFVYVGYKNGGNQKLFYGPTVPAGYNGNIEHTQGNNLDILDIDITQQFFAGRLIGIYAANNAGHHNAGGASCRFPLDIMIADTHKVSWWTNSNWLSDDVSIKYNFTVVPE